MDEVRRKLTSDFLLNKRAWPLYPSLPVKKIRGDQVVGFGDIAAPNLFVVRLKDGTQEGYRTLQGLLDAGWAVD